MKNKIALLISTLGLATFVVAAPVAAADTVLDTACQQRPNSTICRQTQNSERKVSEFIQDVISTLLYVLGAICVIVIIVGGIRYATADGDSSKLSQAKNTILYAVIGLVVALLAYAIVFFVLGRF